MGWLSRVLSGSLRADTPNAFDDHWYQPVGTLTESGVRVDAEAAQKISAWYRGRDILATVLAMLPLQVFERLPNNGGANPAYGHPLYDVLHNKPNPRQDSFQWRRQAMYHLIDHGNSYHWTLPGPRGPIDQLEPIADPTTVTPKLITSGLRRGRRLYDVRDPKTGITTEYNDGEIFHLMGASSDGIAGKGILAAARTSIGTALATESYAARTYSRGTLNSGVIEVPATLDDEASRRMARSFVTAAGEWHLPKVLEQGSKWIESKLTPEDAQMLLSRKFSIDDMARWLGVPRMMLENSDPSFGNAEQFDQNLITYTMGSWLSLWEFAINHQLILNPARFFAEFKREAFVRGKFSERIDGLVKAAGGPFLTRNEARKIENRNRLDKPEYDELLEQQNITGKSRAAEPGARTPPEDDEDRDQARAIAVETAARLLRKEVAAVQKMAVRHAGDEDAFVAAVTAFYVKHVSLVEESLHLSHEHAEAYCAEQAHQVVNLGWLAALETWKTADYAEGLAGLALERTEAA